MKMFQYALLTIFGKIGNYVINGISILFGKFDTIRVTADLISRLAINYDIRRDFLCEIDRLCIIHAPRTFYIIAKALWRSLFFYASVKLQNNSPY